jgi:hypothetical protein
MSHSNADAIAIRALCNHYADRPMLCIDSYEFAEGIHRKLPGSVVAYGYAAGEERGNYPHSWIRVGKKDYDVQLITQRLRAFKSGFAVSPDRVLAAEWDHVIEHPNSYAEMLSSDVADWFLPSCAACRGKKRGHTLGGGCTYSRKAEYIERRAAAWESIKNVPLMFSNRDKYP